RPQRMINRCAGQVRGGCPDQPASMADGKRQPELRHDEQQCPQRAQRLGAGERTKLRVSGKHAPPALRVRLTVGDVDVIERSHCRYYLDKVVCWDRACKSAPRAAAMVLRGPLE